jgi:hypothetical protein
VTGVPAGPVMVKEKVPVVGVGSVGVRV